MKLSSFQKTILASVVVLALVVLVLSQATFAKRVGLPTGLFEMVRDWLASGAQLSACDYKDGEIILVKPVATGVGEGRYEAGDIVEIRDGAMLCQRFGNGNFLGNEERTQLLPLYYPAKLTEEQKSKLLEPEFQSADFVSPSDLRSQNINLDTASPEIGKAEQKILLRRQHGVDYAQFLSDRDILKVRSFQPLDRLPEIDLSDIIDKKTGISFNDVRHPNIDGNFQDVARQNIDSKTTSPAEANFASSPSPLQGEGGLPAIALASAGGEVSQNQKALAIIQDSLTRRATELHRILGEENHPGINWWPTLAGDTLLRLRNLNYSIAKNKNNFSQGEAVSDSLQENTAVQLIPGYFHYSVFEKLVKALAINENFSTGSKDNSLLFEQANEESASRTALVSAVRLPASIPDVRRPDLSAKASAAAEDVRRQNIDSVVRLPKRIVFYESVRDTIKSASWRLAQSIIKPVFAQGAPTEVVKTAGADML